jgi:hypothetical protein
VLDIDPTACLTHGQATHFPPPPVRSPALSTAFTGKAIP